MARRMRRERVPGHDMTVGRKKDVLGDCEGLFLKKADWTSVA